MSESEIARIFEKLDFMAQGMARMEERQLSYGSLLSEVRSEVRQICIHGCEQGERHEREITALKGRPEKALATAATVAGLISAIFGLLIWFVNAASIP